MMRFDESTDFEWDKGNEDKNWLKHQVSKNECEEVFFDIKNIVFKDFLHSLNEKRKIIIGKTKLLRLLTMVFTMRKNKIRIISARSASKKEKAIYEKKASNTKI